MHPLDYAVIALFFVLVAVIGWVAVKRIRSSDDYFVAGGRIPWWLGGISHHVSGHSGVVFVAYAAIAYTHGFTLYVWWAGSITIACFVGAFLIAPRWARLRAARHIESPTEYLAVRYGLATQQVMAWSGQNARDQRPGSTTPRRTSALSVASPPSYCRCSASAAEGSPRCRMDAIT